MCDCQSQTCVETEVLNVLAPVVVREEDEVLAATALHPEVRGDQPGYLPAMLRSSHCTPLTSTNLH